MLLLLTDGVDEAQDRNGQFFGFDRLEALLAGLPPDVGCEALIDAVLGAVDAHLDGQAAQDDITVVVMQSQARPMVAGNGHE